MWLFTKNSFVSIVEDRRSSHNVLVRARRKQDLVRLFPNLAKQIFTDPDADYKYRLMASKKEVAKVVSQYIINQLTYDNFKAGQDEKEKGHNDWMTFLHGVWELGYKMQNKGDRNAE